MLRVDEAKVRTLCYGIAQRKRSVGENAEDVPHVFGTEIFDNCFRNICLGHDERFSLS
jgi:hypothetical protein